VSTEKDPPRAKTGEVRATQAMLVSLCDWHNGGALPHYGRARATVVTWDFDGLDFRRMNFSDATFLDCSFRHADLRETMFQRSRLWGALFDDADASRADFADSDLSPGGAQGHPQPAGETARRSSRFTRAVLQETNLSNAKLAYVDFDCALLERTNLRRTDLRGARFRAAELVDAALEDAMLAGADFSGAACRGHTAATLRSRGMMQAAAELSPEELAERLRAHELWVRSGGRRGRRAELSNCDLSGTDLSHALLAAARLDRAIFAEARFAGAMLAAARFRGANLRGADFTAADLRGADLRGANLRGALLDDAVTGFLPGTALMTRLAD
jgi:uncharacterized protein YjbI with pentapeptide repeats